MALPTVTVSELSDAINDKTINVSPKKVLEGLLNDYMDLQYGKETPYTTGEQVIPSGATLDDVDRALEDDTVAPKFKEILETISETEKSGDSSPRSENDGTWDPKLKPVLVLVTANK